MSKITLLAEKCFIIKSVRTMRDGSTKTAYYMTPSMWNSSPLEATIFQDYEAGEGHLNMHRQRDWAPWGDGSVETLDVVPLHGELVNLMK